MCVCVERRRRPPPPPPLADFFISQNAIFTAEGNATAVRKRKSTMFFLFDTLQSTIEFLPSVVRFTMACPSPRFCSVAARNAGFSHRIQHDNVIKADSHAT